MKTVFIVVVYKIQTISLEFYEFALWGGRGRKTPCYKHNIDILYGETCFVRTSLVIESSPEYLPHSLVNRFVFSLFYYLSFLVIHKSCSFGSGSFADDGLLKTDLSTPSN